MTIAIAIHDASQIGSALRWPLRIAALQQNELVLVVQDETGGKVDLARPEEAPEHVRDHVAVVMQLLDTYIGDGRWCPASAAKENEDGDTLVVRLKLAAGEQLIEQARAALHDRTKDQLVLVTAGERARDTEWYQVWRDFFAAPCEVICIVPGERDADERILVGAVRGPQGRTAIRLAAQLAGAAERPLTGLYVQPDIGPDSPGVGRRILDRRLAAALEDGTAQVERQVEVADRPEVGILRACEDERCELLVMGASHAGAPAAQHRGVSQRVHRGTDQPTVMIVRARIPVANRLRRWFGNQLHRHVPQLNRDERTDLVTRIQSNSKWNFDFVMLTALSTLIAAMGLLDNSAPVIIGAMLVAPLMTPLLGIGLGLSQGNPRLAAMSVKAVVLGFVTAFILAFVVGLLTPGYEIPSPEMEARDWPSVLDLVVAFVSGLAAAYASGRPGLLAALPGVAIAAALLPPIATSGLAASIGDFDVALGAFLLFAVNMIAIILAAAMSLWAVGLRRARKPTLAIRIGGAILVAIALAMTVRLALVPPLLAPPQELVEAVEAKLGVGIRLRQMRLRKEDVGRVLQIDIGGAPEPPSTLNDELLEIGREHLGEDVGVRLTYRYEVLTR